MADDGSQQRKPDFRTAVEDAKVLATVLVMELESVLGRRLKLRSPAVVAAIGVVATLVLALVVVMVLLQAGDANAVSDNAALIAAVVALGSVFTTQMVSISLDERRALEARDIEAQRAHETALQNYIKAVGELLIEKPLREAGQDDNLSTVVRAQTLSVLEGLDPDRKRTLLQFLHESGLIRKDKRVVSLGAADLREANLRGARLREANLSWANLSGAYLTEASLGGARLRGTNLSGADMSRADMSRAYLNGSILGGANLSGADMTEAFLQEANLSGANLSGADIRGANLQEANLSGANLNGSILKRANVQGATGVTSQRLEQLAYSLQGAIMPGGSKHP
jgi:uncharacterized protein YjbI with pentapeptide repeats